MGLELPTQAEIEDNIASKAEIISPKLIPRITFQVMETNDGGLKVFISPELLPAFRTLINRGLNVWDRAPAEVKELGDIITEGKVLQNYHSQKTADLKY